MGTVLVVDDDVAIAEVVTSVLEDEGYHVAVAGNGQEALDYLKTELPDLVISDVMMPVLDGREMCRRMQANYSFRSVPIVLMSAARNSDNVDGCRYSAFIRKPFSLDELLEVVAGLIGKPSTYPGPG